MNLFSLSIKPQETEKKTNKQTAEGFKLQAWRVVRETFCTQSCKLQFRKMSLLVGETRRKNNFRAPPECIYSNSDVQGKKLISDVAWPTWHTAPASSPTDRQADGQMDGQTGSMQRHRWFYLLSPKTHQFPLRDHKYKYTYTHTHLLLLRKGTLL